MPDRPPPRIFIAAALICVLGASAARAVEIFDYCLAHRDQCAFSVSHLTEGWERHLNADRLQITASTFKVLALIVYAQAVVDGKLDPQRTIPKEEWARFWVGRDGGALARSWEGLGRPDRVEIDQMMQVMIRESDNASPDWLLHELGAAYFRKVLARVVDGYHDTPRSIAASFLSWSGNPEEPEIGLRVLGEYSGMDAFGFQKEVDARFRSLENESVVAAARRASCQTLPWETADPGCSPQLDAISQSAVRRLLGGYFLQSTSRTYNRLLAGILEGTLLAAPVEEIVVRHLEWQLENPEAAALASRLGSKGGSLAPQNVCNLVAYGEAQATGERVVTSVFVQDVPLDLSCGDDIEPGGLFEAIFLEPGFKQELMERLPPELPKPELLARHETLKLKTRASGDRLKTRIRLRNLGTADAATPFEVWLVVSDDARVDRRDTTLEKWVIPFLAAGADRALRFNGKRLEPLAGKYLFLRVDRKKEIAESGEDNDRPWQLLR